MKNFTDGKFQWWNISLMKNFTDEKLNWWKISPMKWFVEIMVCTFLTVWAPFNFSESKNELKILICTSVTVSNFSKAAMKSAKLCFLSPTNWLRAHINCNFLKWRMCLAVFSLVTNHRMQSKYWFVLVLQFRPQISPRLQLKYMQNGFFCHLQTGRGFV